MLGKRPHQIQRSTSMSQLRVPPGARTRPSSAFAHAKKDCVSQNDSSPSVSMKAAGTHNLQPNAMDDAHIVEMKIEGAHNVNMVNVSVSPQYTDGHVPLKIAGSSSPLPKHTKVESFLDACFFCKRPLGQGRDIFMYRGDAAFCTEECRLRQISCDEKCSVSASQTTSSDNTVGNPKSTRVTTPTGAF